MLVSTVIPDDLSPGEFAWLIKCQVEGLARACLPMWRRWGLPPLYRSGVRFALPPEHARGVEVMMLPPDVHRLGWGDCDRLTIWRLTELLSAGVKASCVTEWRGDDLHVLVGLPDGRTEDPSLECKRLFG